MYIFTTTDNIYIYIYIYMCVYTYIYIYIMSYVHGLHPRFFQGTSKRRTRSHTEPRFCVIAGVPCVFAGWIGEQTKQLKKIYCISISYISISLSHMVICIYDTLHINIIIIIYVIYIYTHTLYDLSAVEGPVLPGTDLSSSAMGSKWI